MNSQMLEYAKYLGKSVVFFYQPIPTEPLYSSYWCKVSGEVQSVLLDEKSCEFLVNDEFYAFSEVIFV
ncbi:hypothetical protein [Moraxella bovis]|uniref:hypothetical protein n=1 Tax=Moraxella bovis TaxID=476 RepID=UPI000991AC6C|nr:hypothetical protein [Moraxella bovis]OOR88193.1 hypothetical protein B0182_10460 [Moraxella bovis]UZA25796.1 hypothetical protein LP117_04910 [Moraxella bovis]UZA31291.1 hypothetical protein LP097_06905 [Moraxella bovis]